MGTVANEPTALDVDLRDLIPLIDVATAVNRHLFTVARWRKRGLRCVKLGRTRYTTKTWLNEFMARQSGLDAAGEPAPTVQDSRARERHLSQVDRELAAAGI